MKLFLFILVDFGFMLVEDDIAVLFHPHSFEFAGLHQSLFFLLGLLCHLSYSFMSLTFVVNFSLIFSFP